MSLVALMFETNEVPKKVSSPHQQQCSLSVGVLECQCWYLFLLYDNLC